ncbi:MAG: hypothetical protein SOY67_03965 [Collinsella sp.]|nr:hypothetical protein [Collinsella sp.]
MMAIFYMATAAILLISFLAFLAVEYTRIALERKHPSEAAPERAACAPLSLGQPLS